MGVPRIDIETRPFFENSRKILINECSLDNAMCIGNFYVAFVCTEMNQKGDFWLEFPKLEYASQSPKHGSQSSKYEKTFKFIHCSNRIHSKDPSVTIADFRETEEFYRASGFRV